VLVECAEGHIFSTTPTHLKKGVWCQQCYRKRAGSSQRFSLVDAQIFAEARGGVCLSAEYNNIFGKLDWECIEGHRWSASLDSVRNQSSWCPTCSLETRSVKRRGSLEPCHAVAAKRGGLCLSTDYRNNHTPLLWRCREGHEWWAVSKSVAVRGSWCPKCCRRGPAP
jgi:hypothetical protein